MLELITAGGGVGDDNGSERAEPLQRVLIHQVPSRPPRTGGGAGNNATDASAPIAAPTNWAKINPGTSLMAIPAKVVVNPRASVTLDLRKM